MAASPLFPTGERPGLLGEGALKPGRGGRAAPGPGSPAGCGHLGQIYFWCREVFSPAGSRLRGQEGAGDGCKTTSRDGLGRGVSPQPRSAPRPHDAPSPTEPGVSGRPPRGCCFPRGATTSSARRRRGQGTPVGTFYRQFCKRGLGQGPRTPPKFSLLRAPRRVPPGVSPPLGTRSPKLGGCLKTKIRVSS